MIIARPDNKFWAGKRVLVTGHTGFKGGWLTLWLNRLGADVFGIGLKPNTQPNLFELAKIGSACESHVSDIRDNDSVGAIIKNIKPEIVFHLAAQPLVRYGYREPVETFSTNVMGTVNVLEALRDIECTRAAVIATTDKVYRNNEWNWPYREDDALGGRDPYSASKAASELIIASYRESFMTEQGVALASARAGNVIGGGDWSEDRLIPDTIRAWQKGDPIVLRKPSAIRPWQHVLDPLAGYMILAEKIWNNANLGDAYNFGPQTQEAASVRYVIELARKYYGDVAICDEIEMEGLHEAGLLKLEISRSKQILGFQPRLPLERAIDLTMDWYRSQYRGSDAHELCNKNIDSYEAMI